MLVATWNVNSLKARLGRVEAWLAEVQPDVVCLQETKLADGAFPQMAFAAMGYDAVHRGEGRWNGVAILSRIGLDEVRTAFHDEADADPEARLVTATCGGIRVTSVYVPNGRGLEEDHYQYKLRWMASVTRHVAATRATGQPTLVCGDFNIAPDDRDVYDPAKLHGATHVSPPERAALAELCGLGLVDTFRLHYDQPGLYSWWDYRAGDFHQGRGLRIDLVLADEELAKRCTWALVDRNARKGTQPSDHAPVVAEFALDG